MVTKNIPNPKPKTATSPKIMNKPLPQILDEMDDNITAAAEAARKAEEAARAAKEAAGAATKAASVAEKRAEEAKKAGQMAAETATTAAAEAAQKAEDTANAARLAAETAAKKAEDETHQISVREGSLGPYRRPNNDCYGKALPPRGLRLAIIL